MNMDQRVISIFHDSIEAKMHAGEYLAPLLATASSVLSNTLINDGKILVAGNGLAGANAQVFSHCLTDRFERDRPSLPAITLGMEPTLFSGIAVDESFNEVYAKQIRALGRPGDTLVLFTESENTSNLVNAVTAAHDKSINVIVLAGHENGNISSVLDVNDIALNVPEQSRPRLHEIHLLCCFCLCDLIDQHIFGAID